MMENRTVFVIAHRLSTVRNSKAIMVLEKGDDHREGRPRGAAGAKGPLLSAVLPDSLNWSNAYGAALHVLQFLCAHLTQTRHAQKTCAEMRESTEKDIRQSLQEHIFRLGKPAQGTDASGIFTAGADDRAGTAADFDVPFDRRRLQSAGNCRELSPRCDDTLAHAGPSGGKRALERRINPQSRRECQIFLTEEGRKTAAEGCCSCFRETEKKMCSGLTEKELEALDAGICRMLESIKTEA